MILFTRRGKAVLHGGIDRTTLRQTGYTLSRMAGATPLCEVRDRLAAIVSQIDALDRLIAGLQVELPDSLLDEMLKSAPDAWICDLLGWTRSMVRHARQCLGIPPQQRWDRPRDGGRSRARWEAQWRARLRELGLWTEAKAS